MNAADYSSKVYELVGRHEKWRLQECLNVAAAENFSSERARELLKSDFGNRYSDDRNFHRGSKYLKEVEELSVEIAKKVFKAKYVDVSPISGHLSDVAALMTLTARGDKVLSVSSKNGGYPGISEIGIGGFIGTRDIFFPFDEEKFNLDIEKSKTLIEKKKPKLIAFGAS
ncbi:MAG: hypothetical protein OK439_03680, partial [Thaumarchaeota archaeon]|nr:hypothetical protein [Nitrososphaerota archaeon]